MSSQKEILKRIKDWFESEEGEKAVDNFIIKESNEQEILNNQLERLNKFGNISDFTEKVIAKYSDNNYSNRWYKRGIVPPEDLSWFLYYYAKKYGRTCNEDEYEKYGNMFTDELFFCDGYYFNKMNGQGSIVRITKSE